MDADRLPITDIQPHDDEKLYVTVHSKGWLVDRKSGAVEKVDRRAAAPKPKPAREWAAKHGGSRRGNRSPDGNWEIQITDNIVSIRQPKSKDSRALKTEAIAERRLQGGVYWAPDSQRFVVLSENSVETRKIHLVESSPEDQLHPKLHELGYAKPGDPIRTQRPHLFHIERGEIKLDTGLFAMPWQLSNIRWNADSSRFTFYYVQRGHQAVRIVGINGETGLATALVDETTATFVDYSNKTFMHWLSDEEFIWASERDGWNHLYLYDMKAGTVKKQITIGKWLVRGVDWVDDENRQIGFRAMGMDQNQDPYHVHHCRVDFDGRNLTRLTSGVGMHDLAFSPDGKYYLDRYTRVDMAGTTEFRRSSDGKKLCTLETADISALRQAGWRPPERFVAKGRDGKTGIYGLIYTPSNLDPTGMYPVIESIYAGPHGQYVPKTFQSGTSAQKMTELGFVLVQIDGMGTNWRSKAFHDVCWQNVRDAGFPDRIAWMQAAAKKRPYMDIGRVGLFGGSAGGQSTLGGLLQHPDFYKAGAADCGCHDNRMDKIWWNEAWMGWPIGPHYEEQSNVTMAHKLQGKLLLTVGELDTNVDPASTMQVVKALIKADKDFELIVFPSGGHGSGGSPYGMRRRNDFFVRHLLGVEPPAVEERRRK
jgi:dipeptidyl aminopeptidase/acylaminoacyl peptidase